MSIPVKLDKRATMRNALKRRARTTFILLENEHLAKKDWQLFFFLNKNSLEEMKQLIATKNKTSIYAYRHTLCIKDFTYILRNL